jgi:tripartite ATP-independent transporter DctM subunit
MAAVPIPDLFLAGLIPGLIMVTAIGLYGVREGLRARVPRAAFDTREALAALWDSKWELMVPAIVLYGVFGGITTLTEAAALVVVYVLLVEVAIHRDLDLFHDVPGIVVNCATLIGGVFVILGAAFGLANYFVDAQIPNIAVDWVKENVESRLLFLLALNVFLLVVGCLLDIFSAIVVVVPLILPISQVFGIHPAHLGIIFLANLELGYITPPVGLNLFLAAYRFDKPMLEVCKGALPFLFVLLSVVLLITYVPELTIIGAGGD